MARPIVAVVGRPNVGKSTFFNKMAGRRVSIVDDMPGVTRDRIYTDVEWCGRRFTLVDTGGLELKSDDSMWRHIKRQAELAMDLAEVILFFTDGKAGVTPGDHDIADMLRHTRKPVVLAVNKVDGPDSSAIYDFYELDMGDPVPVSAEQSLGLGDLLDEIVSKLSPDEETADDGEALKIAVVGKPNSGKSSLVNRLLGYERVIVSPVAGTTRDAVDTPFEYEGRKYILIDTAGIRKKSKVGEDVEYYSVVRSISAIRRADVVLVMVDAAEGFTEQDVKIAALAHEAGKPGIIVMNKWDAVEKDDATMNRMTARLKEDLKFMDYFRVLYISALNGQRVKNILPAVREVYEHTSLRVSTGVLNDVIGDAVTVNPPPTHNGRRLKILYCTEVSVCPPSFVIFVNDPALMHFSYKRYLENSLRKAFDFSGTPIRITIRAKNESDIPKK